MPDKKYLIEIPDMPDGSGVWDADKWERNKDAFMADYPNAQVFELGEYDEADSKETDQILLSFEDEASSGIWDQAKWERNKYAFTKDNPEAQVSRVRYVDYWGQKAEANRAEKAALQQPDEERNAKLAELGYYDDLSEGQRVFGVNAPSMIGLKPLSSAIDTNSVSGHTTYLDPRVQEFFANDTAYTDKMAEIARLDAEYEQNPNVIAQREWEAKMLAEQKAYADNLEKQIRADLDSDVDAVKAARGGAAKRGFDPMESQQMSYLLDRIAGDEAGSGEQENEKLERYTTSLKLLEKAKVARDVAGKGFGGAVIDWAKEGFMDAGTQSDIEAYNEIGNILTRLEKEVGDLKEDNLTEEVFEKYLSKDEQALIKSFFEYNKAMADAQQDMSRAYKGGKIFAESIPFMLEFLATGGIYKGAGRAATKGLERALVKWVSKAARNTASKTARKFVTAASRDLLYGLTGTAARTLASPGTYERMAEASVEIEDGHLNRAKNAAIAAADMYVENLSEISGGLIGKTLGWAGKGVGKLIAKTPLSKVGGMLADNKLMQSISAFMPKLEALGFHGLPEEIGEEFIGNAIREVLNIQPGALKEMVSDDNFGAMLIGFAPMTLIGAAGGAISLGAINYEAAKLGNKMREMMSDHYSAEEMDAMMSTVQNAGTAEEIQQAIKPMALAIANAAERGMLTQEQAAEEIEMLYQWGGFMAQNNALLFSKKAQDNELANAKRAEMVDRYGRFWQEDETESVQVATLNNGSTVFVTSAPAEDGEITTIDVQTGKKGFANISDIASTEVEGEQIQSSNKMTMAAFLNGQIAMGRKTAEETRMTNERNAQIDALRAEITPGTRINLGTEGSPVYVFAKKTSNNGVTIVDETGMESTLGWEQAADALGKPIIVETDQQKLDAEVSARLQRLAERRMQRNISPAVENATAEAAEESAEVVAQEQKHIPLNEDGTVNEAAFWTQDPEGYAEWNDEQNQDGGQDTLRQIAISKAEMFALLAEAQSRQNTSNPAARKAAEKEAAIIAEKIQRLQAMEMKYADALAEEKEAVKQTAATPTATMSEEQLEQMDAQYQGILGKTRIQSERVRVMQEYLDKLAENSAPIKVLTKDNYEEVMRAEGCPEDDIKRVGKALNRKRGGQVAGFASNGVTFVMANTIADINSARITYIHERQHLLNSQNPEVVKQFAAALGDKENALRILETFVDKNGLEEYENDSIEKLADEIICRSMEIVYSTENYSVDLQNQGLSEEAINIINTIDNGQRTDKSLSSARRSSYVNGSRRENIEENGRNSEQVSGGILGEQETGSLGSSGRGDGLRRQGSTGERAEVISEEQLNAPNSGTAQQITATDGEVLADTDGKGGVRFSIRTWNEGGRDYLAAWLANDTTLTEEEKADIIARMDEFYKNALLYSDTYAPFGTWSDAGVRYDNNGNPLMSVIKANGDYAMNLDFSLVCKKRRPLNRLLRTLVNHNAFATYTLRERELAEINWILQEHGFEVACALCFVDSKRYRVAGVADVFALLYNRLVKALAPKGVKVSHFNYNDNPNVEVVENGLDTLPEDQINWAEFDRLVSGLKPNSVEYKVAQYLREHPEARKLVDATDFIEAEGFESVKENNPDLLKFYNMKKGTGGPKASFGDVQYLNDILKKEKSFDAEKAYAVGGVRLQSFSDFVPHMYFDYMQLFAELAAKKLPLHAYTKEVLFAKIFGLTGAKINMSLVPAVVEGGIAPGLDAEGNYAWADPVTDAEGNVIQQGQSFPYDEAMAIQQAEGYSKNCGVIAVGISDAHIEKMLDDPNIPFIIPYHKSSLNAIVARMTNIDQYKDYTNVQNTRKASGSKLDKGAKDFNFNEYLHGLGESGTPQQAAQAYLDWCRENNYKPKFSQFAYHPNYYKLLQDFNTIDLATGEYAPQGAVTMTFPTEESAFGNVETLIQQGLQEDAELEEKMEQEIDGIADQVLARLEEISKEPKMSEKQQAKKMAELADERIAKIRERAEQPIDVIEEARRINAMNENADVAFRFIGEMGAIMIDRANEAHMMMDLLEVAREMVQDGRSEREIKLATGWERGADGKWRYEEPDFTFKTKPGRKKTFKLSELIEDETLFEAYPEFKDIQVKFTKLAKGKNGEHKIVNGKSIINLSENLFRAPNPLFIDTLGAFQKNHPEIYNLIDSGRINKITPEQWDIFNMEVGIVLNNQPEYIDEFGARETLAHEIQHAIQRVEGFARGGAASMIDTTDPQVREERNALKSALNVEIDHLNYLAQKYHDTRNKAIEANNSGNKTEGMRLILESDKIAKEWLSQKTLVGSIERDLKKLKRLGDEGYKKLAGEVEARNVMSRLNMSFDERRQSLYSDTQDVATEEQIFLRKNIMQNYHEMMSPSVSFRITPEMDAEYLAAVERGDMETAQRMVIEAAKLAMLNTKVVDEDGNPMVMIHNTASGDFTIFDPSRSISPNGAMWFANEKGQELVGGFDRGERDVRAFLNSTNPTREGMDAAGYALEEGYDGVIVEQDGAAVAVVYNPSQIKSADPVTYDDSGNVIPLSERFNPEDEDIRFRVANDNQAIFVSNAARAVEVIKMEKATPEQWLKMIEKNGGLKAGEDKWMGLSDWLKASDKKTLTKQEVLDFINENMIVIEEVHYGEMDEETREFVTDNSIINMYGVSFRDSFNTAFVIEENFRGELYVDVQDYEEAISLYNEHNENKITIDPADIEYGSREETLLKEWATSVLKNAEQNDGVKPINTTRKNYTTEGLDNLHEIALTVPSIESWNESDEIHFGDAGDGRAVAWIRFGETTDESGNRVLVIDEIQSKRHQEGREKGYRVSDIEQWLSDNNVEVVESGEFYEFIKNGETDRRFSKGLMNYDIEKAKRLYVSGYNKSDIPDAPFEKNWHELAMKRMLRFAAENGYDVVAWTKGDQQAERYNIGQSVGKIEAWDAEGFGDTARMIDIYAPNGVLRTTLYVNSEGLITSGEFEGSQLSEVVGKEMAVRLMSKGEVVLEGEGLRIGGEGMKGFYDKMLPAFMNKYGKKWGVKVEDIELPNLENGLTMHSVPVTEEMKASVMEGQVMFRTTAITQEVQDEMDAISATAIVRGNYLKAPNGADTNLTPEQWAMVRTKAFKAWFGDWEKAARIQKLRNSEDASINGDEIAPVESLDKKAALEYGKKLQGFYTNKDTGASIQLQRGRKNGGVNEVLQHNYKDAEHLQSIAAIPQIIEKSIFIESTPNADIEKNPDVVEYQHFVCGLKIGGEDYTVHSLVAVDKKGDRYYDHNLTAIEKKKLLDLIESQAVEGEDFGTTPGTQPTILSTYKGKQLVSLLQVDASKVVDANGEPKVVYHQTNAVVYINRETGENWDELDWRARQEWDERDDWEDYWEEQDFNTFSRANARTTNEFDGFFFAPEYDEYHEYGDRTIAAFVNIKNPASREDYHIDSRYNDAGRNERIRLQEAGFDGVIRMDGDNVDEYIAFEPNQIKSATDNTGEFSTEDKDIRYRVMSDVNTNPTEAQKKAGNYKMGHIRLDGYNITIENPKGSVRRGADSKGNAWENTLNNDYGYIRGTEGVDGDHIDVYLSDSPTEGNVFVIDQVNPETREFDEHKVMYGFNSAEEAREAYLANFSEGWNGLGTITEVSKDEFKKWIESSHRKTKPFSEYKSVRANEMQATDESELRYRVVSDQETLDRLNSEPTIKVYRAMQLIDGKLYPPMSAKVDGELRQPIELGQWEEAEERPDLVDEKGRFKLDKGNKSSLKARYNPYFHTSPTPLNDQFSSAQTRPELVTVEVEVPESELTSGYKAEKAKDSVGKMEWKAGVVQSKLSGTRTVILSRWDKPVRIVPDSEVADVIVDMFEGRDITMPSNVVTPSLRAELEKRGVQFVETDNQGNPVEEVSFRVTGTPTDEVVTNGLQLTPAQTAEVAANIFAALPEESRKKITEGLNGNILGLKDAILQIPTSLATKENWNDEDRAMAEVVREVVQSVVDANPTTRPLTTREALWMLYDATTPVTDLVSAASRAFVAHNLGFDPASMQRKKEVSDYLRFRTASTSAIDAATDMYNYETSLWTERLKESWLDMNQSVKSLQEALAKSSGMAIEPWENIVFALNQLSSKSYADKKKYMRDFLVPLWDAVMEIVKVDGKSVEEIERYMMLKHGLERNKKFAARDAKEFYRAMYDLVAERMKNQSHAQQVVALSEAKKALADIDAKIAVASSSQLPRLNEARARALYDVQVADLVLRGDEKLNEQELQDYYDNIDNELDHKYWEFREKDYGGLTSMFVDTTPVQRSKYKSEEAYQKAVLAATKPRFDKVADMEAEAQAEVDYFEKVVGAQNLWDKVNAATKETLRHQYEAGMITIEQYEAVRDMFKYYVPLRGFADNTAVDMYSYYMDNSASGFAQPILGAKGRKTRSESPLGWIGTMAESAIQADNKNEAKMTLYYATLRRPNQNLLSITETWYEYIGRDANNKKIFAPAYPPATDRALNADELRQHMEDWEDDMRKKQSRGEAYKGSQKVDLKGSVVFQDSKEKKEHIIRVKVAGKDYSILINGNPRAAQAINGLLNPDAGVSPIGEWVGKLRRGMSSLLTSFSPLFWVANYQRDLLSSFMRTSESEGWGEAFKYLANRRKAWRVASYVYKYENGTLGNSYYENLYKEFAENGGITGYTVLTTNKEYEQMFADYAKNVDRKVLNAVKGAFDKFMQFGEAIEQVSRFAAYITARESGKSIEEAVSAAKEVSVNFNRKGSAKPISLDELDKLRTKDGKKLNAVQKGAVIVLSAMPKGMKELYFFFNASVQALSSSAKLAKKSPGKAVTWAGLYFGTSIAMAMLNYLLSGDDDDEYLDLPDYLRHSTLLIKVSDDYYFKWSLPQEMRPFYAWADLLVSKAMGKMPHKNLGKEMALVAAQWLPVNPFEAEDPLLGLIPDYGSPIAEAWMNKTSFGGRIYDDMKFKSEAQREDIPAYRKATEKTGKVYVDLAELLNDISGGDEVVKGGININPAVVEHLVEGYGGGIYDFAKMMIALPSMLISDDPVEIKKIPFVNKVIMSVDETNMYSHVNDAFWHYSGIADNAKRVEKEYRESDDPSRADDYQKEEDWRVYLLYKQYEADFKNVKERLDNAVDKEEEDLLKQEQNVLREMFLNDIAKGDLPEVTFQIREDIKRIDKEIKEAMKPVSDANKERLEKKNAGDVDGMLKAIEKRDSLKETPEYRKAEEMKADLKEIKRQLEELGTVTRSSQRDSVIGEIQKNYDALIRKRPEL